MSSAGIGKIKEIRIIIPMSLEEYKVGRLYTLRSRKSAAKAGEGFHLVESRAFDDEAVFGSGGSGGAATIIPSSGHYMKKMREIPAPIACLLKKIVPGAEEHVQEETWVNFPHARTIYSYGSALEPVFSMQVDSLHVEGDHCGMDNAFNLSGEELAARDTVLYDYAADFAHEDGTEKAVIMTIYKLVRTRPGWTGTGTFSAVEPFFIGTEEKVVAKFHKEVCQNHSMGKYKDVTLEDQLRQVKEAEDLKEEEKGQLLADISAF